MARWEFRLPDIGEGVTEGEIVQWLVAPGDSVIEDQPLVEVMTDKATVTITSPRAGRVTEVCGAPGSVATVHSILVVFDVADAAGEANVPAHAATPVPELTDVPSRVAASGSLASAANGGGSNGTSPASAPAAVVNENPLATPSTRKFARDVGVDLHGVLPTGPQGRVTRRDVEAALEASKAAGSAVRNPMSLHDASSAATASSAPVASAAPVSLQNASSAPPAKRPVTAVSAGLEERVPFAGLRRRIASKMSQSVQTAAHFTFVEECDCTALKALRGRLRPLAEAKGIKLTFLPFIVKAVVAALKTRPILNSTLDETTQELVYRKFYNIGIAASTDAGLIVPVVKNADQKSLLEIAQDIERIAADAKAGKAKVEDLQGSTFTITSLGADGGLFATPIINFPEVGILGVHQMKQKPVVRDGQIAIGDVMLLSLSFDHRIVDGHVGAAFAYDIIGYLQNPDRLFLEMA